jgi:hypothetical protein
MTDVEIDIKGIMRRQILRLGMMLDELSKQLDALKREAFTRGINDENELIVQDKKTIHYYVVLIEQYLDTVETLRKWIDDYKESGFAGEQELMEEKKRLEEMRSFLEKALSKVNKE